MNRSRLLALAGLLTLVAAGTGVARATLPLPEPNAVTPVTASPCTAQLDNVYETNQYAGLEKWDPATGRYPGDCQRLHFAFGPLQVKPGQNDVLLQPVAIEKPQYAGYMVRMRPDLVYVNPQTGNVEVPPIEKLHLHHATWLSEVKGYGAGPWFASGEEKTISDIPKGYGMPISPDDDWQLLYMIHNQTAQHYEAWITYDIDFVPKAAAEQKWGIQPAYPIWLDVGNARPVSGSQSLNTTRGGYPVFNVQRGFGDTVNHTCTWPAQNCAAEDPWGGQSLNNGVAAPQLDGTYFSFPSSGGKLGQVSNFTGGTIIGLGGHLHPGGLTDNVDLLRGSQTKRIFTSQAVYWDWNDPTIPTPILARRNSWDMSMTVTGLPRWGVHVLPGDKIRINATYDTTIQSTYEDMGIVVAYVAPDKPDGTPTAPNLDPFSATSNDTSTDPAQCLGAGVLCDKGTVTHGHMDEAKNHGGGNVTPLSAMPGQVADHVHIGGFLYTPGDLTTINVTGIPTVKLGQKLEFVNEDAALDVYHTATSCAYPCSGSTGIAYPLANAGVAPQGGVDFDSAELGYGPPVFGPASNTATWDLSVDAGHGFQAGSTYTYFCRIHPFMRGAFEVSP
jgi:plastocyanin